MFWSKKCSRKLKSFVRGMKSSQSRFAEVLDIFWVLLFCAGVGRGIVCTHLLLWFLWSMTLTWSGWLNGQVCVACGGSKDQSLHFREAWVPLKIPIP